jgi:hypothetical protein
VTRPFGILEAEDQHVLGEPAFVAPDPAADPEREALLGEQRVAAVPGADAPDQPLLGEMADEPPVGIEVAQRVEPPDELVRSAQVVQGDLSPCGS